MQQNKLKSLDTITKKRVPVKATGEWLTQDCPLTSKKSHTSTAMIIVMGGTVALIALCSVVNKIISSRRKRTPIIDSLSLPKYTLDRVNLYYGSGTEEE